MTLWPPTRLGIISLGSMLLLGIGATARADIAPSPGQEDRIRPRPGPYEPAEPTPLPKPKPAKDRGGCAFEPVTASRIATILALALTLGLLRRRRSERLEAERVTHVERPRVRLDEP